MVAIGVPAIALVAGLWRVEPTIEPWQLGWILLVVTTAASHLLLGRCYMTHLENWLVTRGDLGSRYQASFLAHYLPFLSVRLVSRLVLLVRLGAVGLIGYLLIHLVPG